MQTKAQNIERLKSLSKRLGIRPADVKVRAKDGSARGITLSFGYRDATITRHCEVEPTRDANFNHLVNWMADLVRNLERRIETLEEAFYADGVRQLPAHADSWVGTLRENHYTGEKTPREALDMIVGALHRLEFSEDDVKVVWHDDPNEALLRLRIGPGRVMEKRSTLQEDPRRNLVALALWLQGRARHVERGIETIERVASPYLQLGAGGTR